MLLSVVGSVRAAEGPRLAITNVQGEFWITWPAWATNWVLEASPRLQRPIPWKRFAPAVFQTNATSRSAQISVTDGDRFFRLHQVGSTGVAGLTGYWPLDEGTGPTSDNDSDPETPMFLTNAVWGPGRIGWSALQFNGAPAGANGTQAWISNANYRVLPRAGDPFSVSLWFNPEAVTTGWRGLVGTDANGSNGWHLALHTPGLGTNDLIFAVAGGANSLSLTGRTLLLPGQWHQLTVTHDGTQGCLYLDGRRLARGDGTISAGEGPIFFGAGVGNYDSFLGRIDEVRTFTNCLPAEQVALTGHWSFDENDGTAAADSSIYAHDATVAGASPWAPGHEDSGIDLSTGRVVIGNDDYTVLPGSGGPFSLSLWLLPRSLGSNWSGLMSCGTSNSGGWRLATRQENTGATWLQFSAIDFGGTLEITAPAPLPTGQWTKLDLTYNGGIATIYVDGRAVQAAHGAIRGSRGPLMLGAVPGLTNVDGVVDDLRIYARERDAAEIGPIAQTMWETVLVNSTTNLVLQGAGPEGRPLVYSIVPVIAATNGTVTHAAGSPIVTYQAGAHKGPDAFTYTVSDGQFTSAPAIVTVSVVEPHWLAPRGGSVEPLDGTTPAQAWVAGPANALDAIWKTNNFYDCFFYAPGEYETRGCKYVERSSANPGCKHIGAGPDQTTLRLVDIWESQAEEEIFASRLGTACDNFEVHNMLLDCNAASLPKFVPGEPIWLRMPLTSNALVHSVTLHWADRSIVGQTRLWLGRAAELSLCARHLGTNAFVTNCTRWTSTGQVDVLTVEAEADELVLELDQRAPGIDFYSLAEIEVSGGTVSLPAATIPDGGESRLDAQHSVFAAVDGDPASSWASGPEDQVQLFLPLAPGTAVTQLNLDWNCRIVSLVGRLGPAEGFRIRARQEDTGEYYDVPFVRHGRQADGRETVTFGTAEATNAITTDELMLVLTNRESGVDYYSLSEVTLQNSFALVPLRLPASRSTLNWGVNYTAFRAFDHDLDTEWACGSQGMVGAVHLHGNNLKFTHLKVIGFGTTGLRECFVLHVLFTEPTRSGNVLVEDCVFTEPAPRNADTLSVVTVAAARPAIATNAIVRRCTVAGVRSQFTSSKGIAGNHVENCLVDDCTIGTYFEPEPGVADDLGPVLIRSNQYVNVDSGVFMLSHARARFDSLACLGNEVILTGAIGAGFSACDVCDTGPSGTITNFAALNNVVRYPGWASRPGSAGYGVFYSNMRHAVIGNNVIALGNPGALRVRQCPAGLILPPEPTEDCDHPVSPSSDPPTYPPCLDILPPNYRRAWYNNRDLAGSLLEIRFSNYGIDGPASQQQWPE